MFFLKEGGRPFQISVAIKEIDCLLTLIVCLQRSVFMSGIVAMLYY